MTDHSPPLPLARLWATSDRGIPYMYGRFGMAILMLVPVREAQADGHTHELCIIPDTPTAAHQPTDPGPCTDDYSVPF